ncbi:MAG: hypothetical protein IPL46_23890 [Saprospiraceae bacterium]|nr:hypothetical protein [Saprospiraceae bacterium]
MGAGIQNCDPGADEDKSIGSKNGVLSRPDFIVRSWNERVSRILKLESLRASRSQSHDPWSASYT